MANLCVLAPSDASKQVFGGIFGTVESIPDDESRVAFKIDPNLKACSGFLSNLPGDAVVIDRTDVLTLSVDDEVADALKATIARGLQSHWNQLYGTLDRSEPTSSVLGQALHAERLMASHAIDALVAKTPDIEPHYALVSFERADVSVDDNNVLRLETLYAPSPFASPTVTLAANVDTPPTWDSTPSESPWTVTQGYEQAQMPEFVDMAVSMNIAVPLYLPKNEDVSIAAREQWVAAILRPILDNPILIERVIKNNPYCIPDMKSIKKMDITIDEYDELDADDDNDSYDRPSSC